jgi:hypothetical protein
MLKHALQNLTVFLLLGFLCKCTDMPESRYVNRTIAPDFVREVPKDLLHEYINRNAFDLQLDSLEAGYDSLQLRIWLGHSMAKVKHVVILKFKDQKWKGQLVSFNHDMVKKVRNVYPGSGWDTLIDSLYKLGIVTLPHETEIAGYNGVGADGISYYFEIATSKKYRVYSYGNPGDNTNFWQAVNVLQMAKLLEKEFDFQYVK